MSRVQIGRLAMRIETHGDTNYWVAYYALNSTMEDAIELGRIAMAAVNAEHRERKLAFTAMMREIVSDILFERTGVRPIWPEPEGRPAPEHERQRR